MKRKILILLFISLLLFGCGKKNKEVKQEEVIKTRELTQEEITNLMNRIQDLSYFDFNPARSFKTNELTNQEVLLWASSRLDVLNSPFAVFEEEALDYLDFSLEPENILCMTHSNILGTSDYLYIYNVETKSYIKNVGHRIHSDEGYYSYIVNRYSDSRFEEDNFIISVYKLFSDTTAVYGASEDTTRKRNWYYSYSDAKNKVNPVSYNNNESALNDLNNIDPSNLIKYTYTFKMKNDNYVLKSYVIEK